MPLLIQLTHTWESIQVDAWWAGSQSIRQKETDNLFSDSLPGSPRSSVFGKTLLVGMEAGEEGQDKRDSDTLNDTKTETADSDTLNDTTWKTMSLLTRALQYCETSMYIAFGIS